MLEKDYLGRALLDGPAPELPAKPVDHIGVHQQARRAATTSGAAPVVGRVSGGAARPSWPTWSRRTAATGCGSPRTRSCWSSTSPPERTESLVDALRGIGLEARPSAWRRGTMACTGIEYCKLAIVETKARGEELVARLEQRLRDFDADISIHINGCPNACARTQVADIGLKGQLVVGPDGEQVEGFQVHLGGGLGMAQGQTAGFGRKLRGLKTTAEELPEYVERLARRYLAGRTRRARRSPTGWSGPTRRHCDERRTRSAPLYCPYCGEEDLRPHEAGARRLGVPRLRPGLHGEVHGLLVRAVTR